jgi:hypothetical protein
MTPEAFDELVSHVTNELMLLAPLQLKKPYEALARAVRLCEYVEAAQVEADQADVLKRLTAACRSAHTNITKTVGTMSRKRGHA